MSSYLTITYNGLVMACVCRSSMLYQFCDAPFSDEPSPLTIDDLEAAIADGNQYIKEMDEKLDDLNWVASRLHDYDSIWDLRSDITDVEKDKKEAETAVIILESLKEIYEQNTGKDRECFELPEIEFVAQWWKD